MDIEGHFFEARSSRSRPARLTLTPQGLELAVEGEDAPRAPTLLHVSERLGSLPRKLSFTDGSLLEVAADALVDGLFTRPRRLEGLIHRLESSWRMAAAAAVVTLALLFVTYRHGLPIAALVAADVTPQPILDLMNEGTIDAIDTSLLAPSTLPKQRIDEVAKLFDGLRQGLPAGDNLELLFRDGGIVGPNAFALPGGTIVITDQLIRLARSEDEIAGVLAHEIGHVERRHSLQQIYRALGIGALVILVGGDSGQLVHDAINQAAVLQTLAYSRAFEAEADARSVALMVAAKRDPLAFIDLLDRITAGTAGPGDTSYFSTHPGTADRRAAAIASAQSLGWCQHCPKPQ